MNPTKKNVLYMLKESNAIEAVYDDVSLVDSYAAWEYIMGFDSINVDVIKETHRILMQDQMIEPRYKGDFRDAPINIGGETKSLPKIVIDSLVRDLCEDINNSSLNDDPIIRHVQFEAIHPFIDGNGRIGRIILNWHLVKKFDAPLLIYTEEDKHTYYMLFPSYRHASFKKDMTKIIESFKDLETKSNDRPADK